MRKQFTLLALIGFTMMHLHANDWTEYPVLADPGSGKTWQLDTQYSNEFNYDTKTDEKFTTEYRDVYINGWTGPGLTQWASDHSEVDGDKLILNASRFMDGETSKVYCGVVTSKTAIKYPAYLEVYMKVSGLKLSSNFWMLSPSDLYEIDINETYGNESYSGQSMNSNWHIFNKDNGGFIDYGHDGIHHYPTPKEFMSLNYHRMGVYWRDPQHFEFYLDGKLVRTLHHNPDGAETKANFWDPYEKWYEEELYIIIDTEDHDWRSKQGITPTDVELLNDSLNKMYVDWIRVYRPTELTVEEKISADSIADEITTDSTFTFKVPYTATESRDVVVEVYKAGVLLGSGKQTVATGTDIAEVVCKIDDGTLKVGKGYLIRAAIRPEGENWESNIALSQKDVTVVKVEVEEPEPPVSLFKNDKHNLSVYPNPASDGISFQGIEEGYYTIGVYNMQGLNVFHQNKFLNEESSISIGQLTTGSYIIHIYNDSVNETLRINKL